MPAREIKLTVWLRKLYSVDINCLLQWSLLTSSRRVQDVLSSKNIHVLLFEYRYDE